MQHSDIYEDKIRHFGSSIFRKKFDDQLDISNELFKNKILAAWIKDLDLQEISFCSTNLGFAYTFQKQYKKDKPTEVSP